MKENTESIQNLNEEELQDITGGCASCEADLKAADTLQKDAMLSREQAQILRDIGGPQAFIDNRHATAQRMFNKAQTHIDAIVKRGHIK